MYRFISKTNFSGKFHLISKILSESFVLFKIFNSFRPVCNQLFSLLTYLDYQTNGYFLSFLIEIFTKKNIVFLRKNAIKFKASRFPYKKNK